jgi:hypothetical protein
LLFREFGQAIGQKLMRGLFLRLSIVLLAIAVHLASLGAAEISASAPSETVDQQHYCAPQPDQSHSGAPSQHHSEGQHCCKFGFYFGLVSPDHFAAIRTLRNHYQLGGPIESARSRLPEQQCEAHRSRGPPARTLISFPFKDRCAA